MCTGRRRNSLGLKALTSVFTASEVKSSRVDGKTVQCSDSELVDTLKVVPKLTSDMSMTFPAIVHFLHISIATRSPCVGTFPLLDSVRSF